MPLGAVKPHAGGCVICWDRVNAAKVQSTAVRFGNQASRVHLVCLEDALHSWGAWPEEPSLPVTLTHYDANKVLCLLVLLIAQDVHPTLYEQFRSKVGL